jgi:hypothetical protein
LGTFGQDRPDTLSEGPSVRKITIGLLAAATAVAALTYGTAQAGAATTAPTITIGSITPASSGAILIRGEIKHTGTANNKTVLLQRKYAAGWKTVRTKTHQDDGRYRVGYTPGPVQPFWVRTVLMRSGVVLDRSGRQRAVVMVVIVDPLPTVTPTPIYVTPTPTPPATIPANPGNTKNCGDFATWADAEAWFLTYLPYYGDVGQLDADNDGIPCESLPGAPVGG